MNNLVGPLLKDTLKELDRHVDLKIGVNSKYDQKDIYKLILMAAVNTTSVESVVAELKEVNGMKEVPSADVVSYHIEKQDYPELRDQLYDVISSSYNQAAKRRLFGKYVAVAIDIHEILYYGEVNNALIMGCKHNRGTSYSYKYANLYDKPVRVGDTIKLNDVEFEVIGILTQIGNPQDDQQVYLSFDDTKELLNSGDRVDYIIIQIKPGEDINKVADNVKRKLMNFRDVNEKTRDFEILTPEELLNSFSAILNIITAFLLGVAGISSIPKHFM